MAANDPTAAAALPGYSGVFVFGDSLVDPGNDLAVFNFLKRFPIDNLPDGAPTADHGYFAGRFSDGYNFADLISNKLLAEPTQATFPYGISNALFGVSLGSVGRPSGQNLSFAYGGALASSDNPAPSLHTQVDIYHNFTADPNALYVISIGANDVLSLVPTGGVPTTGSAAAAKISAVASEIAQDVVRLLGQGARHVVVADVPDVGVVPAYAGAEDEATRRSLLTQYAQQLDAQLQADLNGIALPQGATLLDYDLFGYTDAAKTNPAAYDFSNVTQALTSVQPNAPDPTGGGFLFFDKLHPTAQAHAQIAAQILGELANPGAPLTWTAAAPIGAQAASAILAGGHSDFAVSLTAGTTYVFDALGVSSGAGALADPLIRILDPAGREVQQGDDGGIGLDSHMTFTAPSAGNYTVEVDGVGVTAGSFRFQAADGSGANLLLNGQLRGSNESVDAGAANDTVAALSGTNVLFGGGGNDSILGGFGFDRINGNQGDDTIGGMSRTGDWLLGGQGNDSIDASVSTGNNIINGNLGNDLILGGSGADTLHGGQGDDVIQAGPGAVSIFGDLGDNTIFGGQGLDTFHAGAGHDQIIGWHAGDHVQVSSGVTWAVSQVNSDVHVAFSNNGEMDLLNAQVSSLQSGWIFTA